MNKKYGIIVLAISVAFVVSSGAFLLASENGTSEISTVTFELKEKKANAPGGVPGPPDKNEGNRGGNGGGKGYKLLKGGVKIQNPPATYVINPTNSESIDEGTVMTQVESAMETWDENADVNIHANSPEESSSASYDEDMTIDKNEIDFGRIDGSGGAIAVTHIVYNNSTKAILEFDIRFDSAEEWGVYGTEEYETTDTVDLLNIATHEAGHTLFLDDLTDDKYQEMTMYGYLTKEDETYKRTLAWGDSDGVNELYG